MPQHCYHNSLLWDERWSKMALNEESYLKQRRFLSRFLIDGSADSVAVGILENRLLKVRFYNFIYKFCLY